MKYDREPKVMFLDRIQIDLACDGDIHEMWINSKSESLPPRQRITINEALVAGISRSLESDDSTPISDN